MYSKPEGITEDVDVCIPKIEVTTVGKHEKPILKEGIMVKKGHVRHNWKSRWFILFSDKLCYYKAKGVLLPKGSITMKGCSVISPDPEYTKKDCVFRMIETYGTEYLLQCSDETQRLEWVAAITTAIRKLNTVAKSDSLKYSDRPTLRSPPTPKADRKNETGDAEMLVILQNRVTHEDLLTAMQDKEAGIELKTLQVGNEFFKLCFSGDQLIDWILCWGFAKTRKESCVLARDLLEKAYLHPIGQTNTIKRESARKDFIDSNDTVYRFSSINNNADIEFDYYSDSSSSDSEEESIIETLQAVVIKQGFLVKKGHVRHNWKVRKFILYDEPIRLSYYSPSKGIKVKKGKIHLLGSEVCIIKTDGADGDMCSATKGNKHVLREHCFLIRSKKGKQHIVQAPSEDERNDWVKLIQGLIDKYDNYDNPNYNNTLS